MISSSEIGYLIILMEKFAYIFFQNENKKVYLSVNKEETHDRKKNVNRSVKRNTKNDRNGQMV